MHGESDLTKAGGLTTTEQDKKILLSKRQPDSARKPAGHDTLHSDVVKKPTNDNDYEDGERQGATSA